MSPDAPTPFTFTASVDDDGLRMDVWLQKRLAVLSRARVQALLKGGFVRIEGRCAKANQRVAAGVRVDGELPPDPASGALPAEAMDLDVCYEDAHLVVLVKPAGLVVHPAPGHDRGTLVNALLHRYPELRELESDGRPGIVHRLDKDTSGVMVIGRTPAAIEGLVAQFKAGAVDKVYQAIVHGIPRDAAGRIESLIGRSAHNRQRMSSGPPRGRPAVSEYRVRERFAEHALLDVRIRTGRTHQVRVHMAHIGHPVLGDRRYGPRRRQQAAGWPVERQMLHAWRLGFAHPADGRRLDFEAAPSRDIREVLERLRAA